MKKMFALVFSALLATQLHAEPRVIGYLPYWAQYSQFQAKDIRYDFVTHVHYGYLAPAGASVALADESDAANFQELLKLAKAKGVKVIGVVGGPGQADAMKESATNPEAFAQGIAQFVQANGLSGVELDWPSADDSDAQALAALIVAVNQALSNVDSELSLSATLLVGKVKQVVYSQATVEQLDYITVSAMDEMTAEESQVKPNCNVTEVIASLTTLTSSGIPGTKLVPVAPLYGKSFAGASGLGSTHQGVGSGNEGLLYWRELVAKFDTPDYQVSLDEASQSEVAVSASETIVFNAIPSIKALANVGKEHGGMALYDLSGDVKEPIVSLLVTMGQVLRPDVVYKAKKKR